MILRVQSSPASHKEHFSSFRNIRKYVSHWTMTRFHWVPFVIYGSERWECKYWIISIMDVVWTRRPDNRWYSWPQIFRKANTIRKLWPPKNKRIVICKCLRVASSYFWTIEIISIEMKLSKFILLFIFIICKTVSPCHPRVVYCF